MSLHPAFQAYLDELNPIVAQAVANGFEPTPESARAALAGLNEFALPAVGIAEISDRVVDVDGAHPVPVRVYVPRPGVPSDVILFVHGGGHMAGDVEVYDWSARRTAAATGMVVVSVDYRRSPEAPFPAGLTDVHTVLLGRSAVLDGVATTDRVHAVADSGGAAKVASIAMRVAAGEWTSPIGRQVLLYPSLDYTLSGESIREFGTGYFLSAQRVAWYFDHYFPAGADRTAASPLFGAVAADMPATLVIAAEYDPLVSEAEAYVARLQEAGADATLVVAEGMIHAYAFFESTVPEAIDRTYSVMAAFLADGTVPERW